MRFFFLLKYILTGSGTLAANVETPDWRTPFTPRRSILADLKPQVLPADLLLKPDAISR